VSVAGGLAACGEGGSPSAQSQLQETFQSHKPIESGRIELSFALAPVGSPGTSAGAEALHLEGPFQSSGPGQLPRFALQISLSAAGHALAAGVTCTEDQLFIELGGTQFQAPASTVTALQQGYAQATRGSSSAASGSTFAPLGVDPGAWLVNPTVAGSADLEGTETVHIVAGLDLPRFFADAEKLSGAGGAVGLGAGAQGSGLFSTAVISALSRSVRSARVDVYTGAHDHLLRRLSLSVTIASTPATRSALGGLTSATLTLVLELSELDRPQTILAPSNPQPISQLPAVLERLGLTGLAQGSGGGA